LSNTAQPSASLRTVIITGGNSGLGYACARSLLEDASGAPPSHIILACRDPVRAETGVACLRDEVNGIGSSAQVEAMRLDLASLQSVREFVDEVGHRLDSGKLPPLYALVCNAGVQSGGKQTFTADGFESTFGVNHLGHFLLVNLLLPRLAPPARVVVVASGTHDPALKTGVPAPAWNNAVALARGELGPLAAKDGPRKMGQRSYSTSKLANVLFSYDLARRLPAAVTVNAFDPGLMPGTGLVRDGAAPLRFLWHHVLPRILPLLRRLISPNIHTPAESGAALARLLLDSALEGVSGKYFEGMREIPSSTESYDTVRAKELCQASMALTGQIEK
jgi:NAD(P)-dependent dehydrogenase (short-subunit alcohol dehydrogenase family)